MASDEDLLYVADDDVHVTSSSGEDGSSTTKMATAAVADDAQAGDIVDAQNNNNNTQQAVTDNGQTSPMSRVASIVSRRNKTPVTPTHSSATVVTLHDVRKFVFQATARSDKRIMGGLRAHTFTSQTFVSSFAVGLAIGSILAIIIKLLAEVGYRVLPYHR